MAILSIVLLEVKKSAKKRFLTGSNFKIKDNFRPDKFFLNLILIIKKKTIFFVMKKKKH